MHFDKQACIKFKNVSMDFLNISITTKSATLGEAHVTFGHATIGNNSLGETVTTSALMGYPPKKGYLH